MFNHFFSFSALLLVLLTVSPAVAGEEGWTFFAEPDDSVPLVLTASSKSQPSMWQKMGTGTKNFVNGTVDLVTLKGLREKSGKAKTVSKYNGGRGSSRNKKKPSFWSSMFGAKEPERPQTLSDFLNQERLDP